MSDPRVGKVLQGRYKLLSQIAEGGMGVVYKAERVGIGRPVVVKFLHQMLSEKPGIVDRFEREARATAALTHPNCVAMVDFGVEEGSPFLVMEYAPGQTLADLLDVGPLAPARAVHIVRQILNGLSHAHARGVLHRDLKPANVMISDAEGTLDFVKILDFGLAKMMGPFPTQKDVTVEGIAIGTPGYMSPEQAAGLPSDRRADIYCTGALLYHMVTGTKVFDGEDLHSVLRRHREETPISPSTVVPQVSISDELEAVILKALQRDPQRRYQTTEEMAAALDETPEAHIDLLGLKGAPRSAASSAHEKTRAEAPSSRARTRPSPMRSLVYLLLGGAAGAIAAWRLMPTPAPQKIFVTAAAPVAAQAVAVPTPAPKLVEPEVSPTPAPAISIVPVDDGSDEDDHTPPPEVAIAPEKRDLSSVKSVAEARALLRKGDTDAALSGLYQLRKQKPPPARAAEIATLIGHVYFDRKWWSDALKEYRFAVATDGRARKDQALVGNLVRALGDGGTYPRARQILLKYFGKSAAPALRRAAKSGPSPLLRKNAQLVLAQVDRARR